MLKSKENVNSDIDRILQEQGLGRGDKNWPGQFERITKRDVERALSEIPGTYNLRKLITLISPAAENYLEDMARLAHQLTIQRFGRTIRLYAPLYLSNYCTNSCRYCGFNGENDFERTRLSIDEAIEEAEIIASEGFKDLLLVSSEDRKAISIEYLIELTRRLRNKFSSISIEIYQMNSSEYAQLFKAGIEGVTLYQETYDRRTYAHYHLSGPKSDYDMRLKAADSIADAGMREIGLGILLGLSDWRVETLALAEHAHYLVKRYWQSHISFSFPRLRPAFKVDDVHFRFFSDKNLVQMITALRLCFADAGIVLSTRERACLRDHLMKLGITKVSAGSRTNPGGYSKHIDTTEQFEISDNRSPAQVSEIIKQQGFEPVWKDWDVAFMKSC